jgi:hypothetical protein
MIQKAARCLVVLAAALAAVAPASLLADDSAAAIAAGGLVPRRETRIVMAKEVLRIGEKKVIVDYDFRNDTDQDVTTEVAFPIPPYTNEFATGPALEEQSFRSFKLWVDGKPVDFGSEATATLNGKNVTAVLKANHIDISTFGHFIDKVDSKHLEAIDSPDFNRLPKNKRDELVKVGIFESDTPSWGRWTVHLQYHWTQTFPAHSTVRIRHEYSPVVGFSFMTVESLQVALDPGTKKKDASRWKDSGADVITGFCADPDILQGLIRRFNESTNPRGAGIFYPRWVDFILTTANTWQPPIEDFTLIIERPRPENDRKTLVSFCSPQDGKVEKLDADHFQVHLTNFVPTSELHIGFFDVPVGKPAKPAAKK